MKELVALTQLSGYKRIIESFPSQIALSTTIGGHHGDTAYILTDGSYWGILVHAYGSCAGCDDFERCDDEYHSLLKLRERLFYMTKWFDSRDELSSYIESTDWGLKVEGHLDGFQDFTKEAIEYLQSDERQ